LVINGLYFVFDFLVGHPIYFLPFGLLLLYWMYRIIERILRIREEQGEDLRLKVREENFIHPFSKPLGNDESMKNASSQLSDRTTQGFITDSLSPHSDEPLDIEDAAFESESSNFENSNESKYSYSSSYSPREGNDRGIFISDQAVSESDISELSSIRLGGVNNVWEEDFSDDKDESRARNVSFDVSMEDTGEESVSIDKIQNENSEGEGEFSEGSSLADSDSETNQGEEISLSSDSFPE
jgi:hypothetical protein